MSAKRCILILTSRPSAVARQQAHGVRTVHQRHGGGPEDLQPEGEPQDRQTVRRHQHHQHHRQVTARRRLLSCPVQRRFSFCFIPKWVIKECLERDFHILEDNKNKRETVEQHDVVHELEEDAARRTRPVCLFDNNIVNNLQKPLSSHWWQRVRCALCFYVSKNTEMSSQTLWKAFFTHACFLLF